jgi:uncharacterized protein YhaN
MDSPAKSPGSLKKRMNAIENTKRELQEVTESLVSIEAKKNELAETKQQLNQIIEEYETSAALLERNRQRKDIETSIGHLNTSYNEADLLLSEVKGLEADLERSQAELAAIEGMESQQQISEYRQRLDSIKIRQDDIRKDLSNREREIDDIKRSINERKVLNLLASRQFLIVSIVTIVVVIGIILLFLAMLARGSLAQERTKLAQIEERIKAMNTSLRELDTEKASLLAKANCKNSDEFYQKEKNFSYWLGQKWRLEAQLRGRLGGKTIDEIGYQRQEIARNLAVEQVKLTESLQATALSPEKYVELETRANILKKRHDELEKKEMECEAAIKWARFDAEDKIKLEEQLESLQESLRRDEYRVKIYELTREYISKAREHIFFSANDTLESEIQKYLTVFTNGKYERVKVEKGSLEFSIFSDEKGDWVKPEELSGGVKDEFYLAGRLALVKVIFDQKRPPLILDDPFSNFDSVRLSKTLELLKEISAEYQVIIFTFKDTYDDIADNIITLN